MLKKIKSDNSNEILKYIGKDYDKCLYLYLDYNKYKGENIIIWEQFDEQNNIVAVILSYYTAVHIYSKNLDCNYVELTDLIKKISPSTINARKEIIVKLIDLLDDYDVEYGWIKKLSTDKLNVSDIHIVKKPSKNDLREIAKLQLTDDGMGSYYSFDVLLKQLKERNNQGFSRNYFIRINNKIVSHAATGGELDNLAIITSVITDEKYRGRGLAYAVVSSLCYDLINEGKNVYLINYTNESSKLYEKIGFEVCCEWGKLYKKC